MFSDVSVPLGSQETTARLTSMSVWQTHVNTMVHALRWTTPTNVSARMGMRVRTVRSTSMSVQITPVQKGPLVLI